MDGGFGQSLGASYFIWDNVNIGLDFSWFNILASSSQISDGTMISGMLSIGYHYSSNSSFEPYVQASIGLASLTRPQPGLINLAGMDDRLLGLKVGVHKKLSEKWDLDFFVSFIDGKTTNFLSTGDPDNIFIYIDSPSSNGPQLKYTHSPRYYYFTFGLGLSYTICGGNE
jgi:opacity protein-like surface antigen